MDDQEQPHTVEFLKPAPKKEELNRPAVKKRVGLDTTQKLAHRERKSKTTKKPGGGAGGDKRHHQQQQREEQQQPTYDDDTYENAGFADWLRSPDGSGLMKLFLVTNTVLAIITVLWPILSRFYTDWRRSRDPNYIY